MSSISETTSSLRAIAMNLLDGDHAANPIVKGRFVIAAFESHDNGTPCTTLTGGWAYDL